MANFKDIYEKGDNYIADFGAPCNWCIHNTHSEKWCLNNCAGYVGC